MERRASPPGQTEARWDCGVIPVFPAIALKALKLLSGTDTSLLELCNLIRADLAFSTAVLRIAPRGFFSGCDQCAPGIDVARLPALAKHGHNSGIEDVSQRLLHAAYDFMLAA
jgi:hypothetical protein